MLLSIMQWAKILGSVLLLIGGVWLFRFITTPPPGVAVEDQGRQHVSAGEVAQTAYKSNPPVSGPHLETWVKPGIYTEPQQEGELIHSLEHGYVVIHYNCGVHLNSFVIPGVKPVFAHEEGEASGSPSANLPMSPIATGSAITQTEACKTLQTQLSNLVNGKKIWKLIVVPRPQLDTTIALAAWGHVDKFDAFDEGRITKFIDYYRDHGPEQTME